MLSTNKSVALTGQSRVTHENQEVTAVSFSANISKQNNTNINQTIVNQEAYTANKMLCRADSDEFMAMVREIEDDESDGEEV